jgi:hypothetical protein
MVRGAKIIKTEDPALLQEEYENITGITRAESAPEKSDASVNYKTRRNKLTKERDKFVAKKINETLKEGETGVLFIGSFHDVLSHLPRDIAVQQVKEREKLNAYFEELISGKNEKRFKQLAEYLILPCVY